MAAPEATPLHITLTFRHRNETSEEDGPRAFWNQVQQNYRNSGFEDAPTRRLEERIISSFGRDLRDILINEFMFARSARTRVRRFPGDERLVEYGPVPSVTIPLFAFQVTGVNYGSLSLGLDIAGVKGLVEFFNNNYALFQTVLTQYAPLAFAVAATGSDTAYIDGLSCSVNAPQQVSDAFHLSATSDAPVNGSSQAGGSPSYLQTMNRMWITANTSLIPAVILALAVLFIAFQSLSSEKSDVAKAMSQLQERQNEVIRILAPQPAQVKSSATPNLVPPACGTSLPSK